MSTLAPRRAVINSYRRIPHWANWFSCTLECGHVVAPGQTPQAPKTCACFKCAANATPQGATDYGR